VQNIKKKGLFPGRRINETTHLQVCQAGIKDTVIQLQGKYKPHKFAPAAAGLHWLITDAIRLRLEYHQLVNNLVWDVRRHQARLGIFA